MTKPNWVYYRAQSWRFYRSRGGWHWSLRVLAWLVLFIVSLAVARLVRGHW